MSLNFRIVSDLRCQFVRAVGWVSFFLLCSLNPSYAAYTSIGGTNGQIQYNSNGGLAGATVGAGLQLSAGTLSAVGAAFPAGVPNNILGYTATGTTPIVFTPSGDFSLVASTGIATLSNTATARTNLGLGGLATLNTVNNSNWSGTALTVPNGGTGVTTLSGVVIASGTTAFTAASLPGSTAQFLNGTGVFSVPTTGTAASYISQAFTGQTSVNVVHNFGAYPVVQVLDNSNAVIIPLSIVNNSANDFTVTFSGATTGTILASLGSPQPPTYTTTAINYTAVSGDYFIEVTASGKTITLPTAVGRIGKIYSIDNSSTGTITVNTTSSQTIEGQLAQTLPSNTAMTVVSNGTNWRIR